jgi:hypothetical protein
MLAMIALHAVLARPMTITVSPAADRVPERVPWAAASWSRLPAVGNDEGTPFAVTVIPVDHELAVKMKRN